MNPENQDRKVTEASSRSDSKKVTGASSCSEREKVTGASSRSKKHKTQDNTAAGSPSHESHRTDLQRALERDFKRHGRREDAHHSFWRWLGVLGMVGWPIAIMTVGGVLLGHYIDSRFNTGIQFTLLLLTIGAVVGSLIAWKVLGAER